MENKKVLVGMSAGVDSSVAAYLMKKAGYKVTGVTMAIWDGSIPIEDSGKSGCFGPGEKQDLEFAKKVSDKLGIEYVVIDLAKEYKETVLTYFTGEYLSGKTPNPCVMCNQKMKFGHLIERSRKEGLEFDKFVTGHYANVFYDESKNRFILQKAKDSSKDQTYFISHLRQEQLAQLIFPLGNMLKSEVRDIARSIGLSEVADKEESQDFIETDDYSVLFNKGDIKPGPIVHIDGRVLGEHKGIVYYTVGQRKGLNLGGASEPLYVVSIDACKNKVVVGPESMLLSGEFEAININWISIPELNGEMKVKAKIRQQHKESPALIREIAGNKNSCLVKFEDDQRAITPGQTVVFYDENNCVIGGGLIKKPD